MPGGDPVLRGRIEKLFLKKAHGQAVSELAPESPMECMAGLGISGDIHAHRLSPRQVLITLASELESLAISPGALHENIVISLARAEEFRPGASLMTASGVEIRLTMFCEPCKRIQSVAPDLKSMLHRRGVLGVVVAGGAIRCGEVISLIPDRYAPLPDSPRQKFIDFVATIPPGRVVRYVDVTTAMGVDKSFIRALPGYLKNVTGLALPIHRIVNGRGSLLSFIPAQETLLAAEGIPVTEGVVDLAAWLWQG